MKVIDSTADGVLCWLRTSSGGADYHALTLEEADALWRELERRCTDERVRRAEAARGGPTP